MLDACSHGGLYVPPKSLREVTKVRIVGALSTTLRSTEIGIWILTLICHLSIWILSVELVP